MEMEMEWLQGCGVNRGGRGCAQCEAVGFTSPSPSEESSPQQTPKSLKVA